MEDTGRTIVEAILNEKVDDIEKQKCMCQRLIKKGENTVKNKPILTVRCHCWTATMTYKGLCEKKKKYKKEIEKR